LTIVFLNSNKIKSASLTPFFINESDRKFLVQNISFLEYNVPDKEGVNVKLTNLLLSENSSFAITQKTIPVLSRFVSP
jgi:hypothetical protein